jgi:hypothetical protein
MLAPANYIDPFDKLRAGSLARKKRGPQDDNAEVISASGKKSDVEIVMSIIE